MSKLYQEHIKSATITKPVESLRVIKGVEPESTTERLAQWPREDWVRANAENYQKNKAEWESARAVQEARARPPRHSILQEGPSCPGWGHANGCQGPSRELSDADLVQPMGSYGMNDEDDVLEYPPSEASNGAHSNQPEYGFGVRDEGLEDATRHVEAEVEWHPFPRPFVPRPFDWSAMWSRALEEQRRLDEGGSADAHNEGPDNGNDEPVAHPFDSTIGLSRARARLDETDEADADDEGPHKSDDEPVAHPFDLTIGLSRARARLDETAKADPHDEGSNKAIKEVHSTAKEVNKAAKEPQSQLSRGSGAGAPPPVVNGVNSHHCHSPERRSTYRSDHEDANSDSGKPPPLEDGDGAGEPHGDGTDSEETEDVAVDESGYGWSDVDEGVRRELFLEEWRAFCRNGYQHWDVVPGVTGP